MLSNLARFLQYVDVLFAERRIRMGGVMSVDQLREPQCTGHPSRPAANDHHISRHLRTLNTVDRFAENEHLISRPQLLCRGFTRMNTDQTAAQFRFWIRVDSRRGSYPPAFTFLTSSISGGTMSNKLPTIA